MKMPWYFLTDVVLCLLAAAAVGWAWPRMTSLWRRSAVITAVVVMVLQCVNEYFSLLVFKAWTFSFAHNTLVGVEVFGVPIEEMLFWFAFAWMIPFVYSGLASPRPGAAGSGREG